MQRAACARVVAARQVRLPRGVREDCARHRANPQPPFITSFSYTNGRERERRSAKERKLLTREDVELARRFSPPPSHQARRCVARTTLESTRQRTNVFTIRVSFKDGVLSGRYRVNKDGIWHEITDKVFLAACTAPQRQRSRHKSAHTWHQRELESESASQHQRISFCAVLAHRRARYPAGGQTAACH